MGCSGAMDGTVGRTTLGGACSAVSFVTDDGSAALETVGDAWGMMGALFGTGIVELNGAGVADDVDLNGNPVLGVGASD